MGELLRLLHAARCSGVLGQIMDSMAVGEQPGTMSDAAKRRKNIRNGMQRLGDPRIVRPLTTRPGM